MLVISVISIVLFWRVITYFQGLLTTVKFNGYFRKVAILFFFFWGGGVVHLELYSMFSLMDAAKIGIKIICMCII